MAPSVLDFEGVKIELPSFDAVNFTVQDGKLILLFCDFTGSVILSSSSSSLESITPSKGSPTESATKALNSDDNTLPQQPQVFAATATDTSDVAQESTAHGAARPSGNSSKKTADKSSSLVRKDTSDSGAVVSALASSDDPTEYPSLTPFFRAPVHELVSELEPTNPSLGGAVVWNDDDDSLSSGILNMGEHSPPPSSQLNDRSVARFEVDTTDCTAHGEQEPHILPTNNWDSTGGCDETEGEMPMPTQVVTGRTGLKTKRVRATRAAAPAQPSPDAAASKRQKTVAGGGDGSGDGVADRDRHMESSQLVDVKTVRSSADAPKPRWGHTATVCGGGQSMQVFVIGGDDTDGNISADILVYDVATSAWRSELLSSKGFERCWHSTVCVPHKHLLVVFGGEMNGKKHNQRGTVSSLIAYNTELKTYFDPYVTGKAPTPRSGHSAAVYGSNMIVFAGNNGRRWINDLFVLDVNRWSWSQPNLKGSPPHPRSYHSSVVLQSDRDQTKKLVIFGGNDDTRSFKHIHYLDIDEWRWEHPELNSVHPQPRAGHATACEGANMIVYGGWDIGEAECNDVQVYNLDAQRWSHVVPKVGVEPQVRIGHTMTLTHVSREGEDECVKAMVIGGQGHGHLSRGIDFLTLTHTPTGQQKDYTVYHIGPKSLRIYFQLLPQRLSL